MGRPLKLEDLVVWKLACAFEDGVLELLHSSPRAMRDLKLYTQLSDAAGSITSNITEGFNRFSASEFAHFLRYSRGSLGEAQRRLRAGLKKGYWSASQAEPWFKIAFRLERAIKGFRDYLLGAAERKREAERKRKAAFRRQAGPG